MGDGLTYGDEQVGMFGGDRSAVGEDRDDVAHVIDEPLTLCSPSPRRQASADLELGDGDGGDRAVVDRLVELIVGAFGVDEECGVEQQQGQRR